MIIACLAVRLKSSRLPKKASINYLTNEERNDLINWDLEIHRKIINN